MHLPRASRGEEPQNDGGDVYQLYSGGTRSPVPAGTPAGTPASTAEISDKRVQGTGETFKDVLQ
eukprot:SAG31_NODE_26713_length_437_cov_3.757396_1_plen_63_part_10